MPRWDLSSRFGFSSAFDEKIDEYVKETGEMAVEFQKKIGSNLITMLLEAIVEFEVICTRRTTVSSFLSLSQDVDLNNDALKKRKAHISQIMAQDYADHLSWFTLDLAAIKEQDFQLLEVGKYTSWVNDVRKQRPHNLEKNVERALTLRGPYTGTRPLVSFLDKELSLLQFPLNDDDNNDDETQKMVNMKILLSRLSSSKDATMRAKCLHLLNEGLGTHMVRISALSLSAVTGSWLIENKERSYPNLRSRRNLNNNVPDDVVNSLLEGVRQAGVPLTKRYYQLKKDILKATDKSFQQFTWSDRNAPISIPQSDNNNQQQEEEKKIEWDEAVHMVERGYKKFSPIMAQMFMDMVHEKRIDVPAADDKKGGAYCAGVVPGIGPFQVSTNRITIPCNKILYTQVFLNFLLSFFSLSLLSLLLSLLLVVEF